MASFGISQEAYLTPFVYGIEHILSSSAHSIIIEDIDVLKRRLLAGDIDGAFISSWEYAQYGGKFCIIPGFTLSFVGYIGQAELFLKSDSHIFRKVAYFSNSPTLISLMRIIFWEKFGMKPEFIETVSEGNEPGISYDATFFTGESATKKVNDNPRHIDFISEWIDLTELPFVFGSWVAASEKLKHDSINELIRISKDIKQWNVDLDAVTNLPGTYNLSDTIYKTPPENCQFEFNDLTLKGLKEFYHLLFYHGMLPGIPDINVYMGKESKP